MAARKKKILVVHGPNLNLLGERETPLYGKMTLKQLHHLLQEEAQVLGVQVDFFQSNSEGILVNKIQDARKKYAAVVLNPAAYTHTSVAIRDAVAAIDIPVVEVHLSNIYGREEFRHHSLIAPVARGQVTGFGPMSYLLGLKAVVGLLES